MGLASSDLRRGSFRRSSASSASSTASARPRKPRKPTRLRWRGTRGSSFLEEDGGQDDEEEEEEEKGEGKRRSRDWERQARGSGEFVRLRKESLFAGGKEPGLTGLKNLGNTCFMNAALQCLSHTAPLTDFFVGSQVWKEDLNKKNPLGTGGKLASQYAGLLRGLWTGSGKAIAPRDFKKTVSSFAPRFTGYAQHDCQELLVFLLDGLHEDLNRVVQKPYVEVPDAAGRQDEVVAAEQWKFHLLRNRSIIVDLLQGQLKSALTCSECGFRSVTFDPFMYLTLPFPPNDSGPGKIAVEDLIEHFLRPETLTGDEAWFCPECKKHVEATKKFDLWKLPPILIIHLKRFKYGLHSSKIDKEVTFPLEDFSFAGFAKGAQRDLPHYDLYAVSRHVGSPRGGHYTALAKNRVSGAWHDFDDSRCRVVPETAVQCRNAYLLFYQNHVITEQGYRRQSVSKPGNWPHALPEPELRRIAGEEPPPPKPPKPQRQRSMVEASIVTTPRR